MTCCVCDINNEWTQQPQPNTHTSVRISAPQLTNLAAQGNDGHNLYAMWDQREGFGTIAEGLNRDKFHWAIKRGFEANSKRAIMKGMSISHAKLRLWKYGWNPNTFFITAVHVIMLIYNLQNSLSRQIISYWGVRLHVCISGYVTQWRRIHTFRSSWLVFQDTTDMIVYKRRYHSLCVNKIITGDMQSIKAPGVE